MNSKYPVGSTTERFSLFIINKKGNYVGNTQRKKFKIVRSSVNEIICNI